MKPTDKVVKLACQLYDAGHRQEIQEGDWVKCDVYKGIHLVCSAYREWVVLNELGHVFEKDCIPIPTLSQCLRWLTENGDPDEIDLAPYGNIWRIHYDCFTYTHAEAPTPEEAAMLAMIKILKGEGK